MNIVNRDRQGGGTLDYDRLIFGVGKSGIDFGKTNY